MTGSKPQIKRDSQRDIHLILQLFSWVSTIALICVSFHYKPFFDNYLAIPLSLVLITFLGIPHGAIDHLLYYQIFRRKMSASKQLTEDLTTQFTWRISFYWNYLSIMAIWATFWLWTPVPTFWAFLLVSSFHFGQGDLDYIPLGSITGHLLFVSRGFMLIGQIAAKDASVTLPIISRLTRDPEVAWLVNLNGNLSTFCVVQHFILLCLIFLITRTQSIQEIQGSSEQKFFAAYPVWPKETFTTTAFIVEMAKTALMTLLFSTVDPLTSFSIYFGLWHSIHSISDFVGFLTKESSPEFHSYLPNSSEETASNEKSELNFESSKIPKVSWPALLAFWKASFLFTFIPVVFMTCVYLLTPNIQAAYVEQGPQELAKIWAFFVVGISILTGPHIWIIFNLHQNTYSLDMLDPFHSRMYNFVLNTIDSTSIGRKIEQLVVKYL